MEPKCNSPEYFEYVDNLIKLILPKLEAVYNSGDSSLVHRAANYVDIIKGWRRYALSDITQVNRIVTCREYIRSAEKWLESIAQKGD